MRFLLPGASLFLCHLFAQSGTYQGLCSVCCPSLREIQSLLFLFCPHAWEDLGAKLPVFPEVEVLSELLLLLDLFLIFTAPLLLSLYSEA